MITCTYISIPFTHKYPIRNTYDIWRSVVPLPKDPLEGPSMWFLQSQALANAKNVVISDGFHGFSWYING